MKRIIDIILTRPKSILTKKTKTFKNKRITPKYVHWNLKYKVQKVINPLLLRVSISKSRKILKKETLKIFNQLLSLKFK